MSWLTFVLLALVLIFAVQGFNQIIHLCSYLWHGNINGILFNGSWCYVLAESVYQ